MSYKSEVEILSKQDQLDLFKDLTDENRATLLESNQRLVFKEVSKLVPYGHWFHEDARQEGMVGLVQAMDRFNPDKGFAFSTFAASYVRGYVKKAIKKSSRNTHCSLDSTLSDIRGGAATSCSTATMSRYVGSDESSPDKRLALSDDVRYVQALIKGLKPIERQAMELYFNFETGQKSTFVAVGKEIGRTKQGTRSIINRALRKINTAIG